MSVRVDLPITGKGTYVKWMDTTPTPHARSPLGFALAAATSASLSLASWGSRHPQTSSLPNGDSIDNNINEHGDGCSNTYMGKRIHDETLESPLGRAVSAVASLGLMSCRFSRSVRRERLHEPGADIDGVRSAALNQNDSVFEPPPGLEPPSMPLASVGSLLHKTGTCKPCAWFWKPQGCQFGSECEHCHVCPSDELQRRKQAKKASRPSGSKKAQLQRDTNRAGRGHTSLERADMSPDDFVTTKQTETTDEVHSKAVETPIDANAACEVSGVPSTGVLVPSEGSRLHSSGACRPCSWFWRPQGCQFGAECLHCHLCSGDEQKRRKREKVLALRAAGVPKNRAR